MLRNSNFKKVTFEPIIFNSQVLSGAVGLFLFTLRLQKTLAYFKKSAASINLFIVPNLVLINANS